MSPEVLSLFRTIRISSPLLSFDISYKDCNRYSNIRIFQPFRISPFVNSLEEILSQLQYDHLSHTYVYMDNCKNNVGTFNYTSTKFVLLLTASTPIHIPITILHREVENKRCHLSGGNYNTHKRAAIVIISTIYILRMHFFSIVVFLSRLKSLRWRCHSIEFVKIKKNLRHIRLSIEPLTIITVIKP